MFKAGIALSAAAAAALVGGGDVRVIRTPREQRRPTPEELEAFERERAARAVALAEQRRIEAKHDAERLSAAETRRAQRNAKRAAIALRNAKTV